MYFPHSSDISRIRMNDFALGQNFVFVPVYLCHMCATHTPIQVTIWILFRVLIIMQQSLRSILSSFSKAFGKMILFGGYFSYLRVYLYKSMLNFVCTPKKSKSILGLYMLSVLTSFTFSYYSYIRTLFFNVIPI